MKPIEEQTEVQRLALELDALSSAKRLYPNGPCGNTIGCESYRLVANGFAFACLGDAARKLLDLEEANAVLLISLKKLSHSLDRDDLLHDDQRHAFDEALYVIENTEKHNDI